MSDEARLKQCLGIYKNAEATRQDVLKVIQKYKTLLFKSEPFIFNDGSSMNLLNLDGTIPVVFKGNSYNIPVCLYLMDTHPENAPLCYVKPTSDMSIKVSRYVDNNGKIYLPYLHTWTPSGSNLIGLIKIMASTFSEVPPVYSKPAAPKPNFYMPQPEGPGPSSYLPYPSAQYPPAGGPQFPMPLPYPQMGYNMQLPSFPGYPPQPPPVSTGSGGTITEEHIKASLRSAVEDKLKRRLREQFSQNQAELETLRRTQQELTDGKLQLDDILNKLQREQIDLDKNIGILQEKEQELEKSIAKLSEQDGVDPDEAVMTTTPLYNQLLNAFAEEATTEDAIYYMGEALRTNVIDLDSFLKQVRALSRKQFTLRALMQKCRQKAGLTY